MGPKEAVWKGFAARVGWCIGQSQVVVEKSELAFSDQA
jgi:hypothetical protein